VTARQEGKVESVQRVEHKVLQMDEKALRTCARYPARQARHVETGVR
jgi:hypothetical protein